MPTIQVRDIPQDAYDVIKRRADAAGQSLQQYMREQVVELARRRSKAEAFAELDRVFAAGNSPGLRMQDIVADLREMRQ